jgi:hypothetical protein
LEIDTSSIRPGNQKLPPGSPCPMVRGLVPFAVYPLNVPAATGTPLTYSFIHVPSKVATRCVHWFRLTLDPVTLTIPVPLLIQNDQALVSVAYSTQPRG